MPSRYEYPFHAIISTAPSFNSSAQSSGDHWLLESTAVNRYWQQPQNRVVRVASIGSADFFAAFGSSLLVASASEHQLFLGGTVELIQIEPSATPPWVSVFGASTDVIVNFTLGHGK